MINVWNDKVSISSRFGLQLLPDYLPSEEVSQQGSSFHPIYSITTTVHLQKSTKGLDDRMIQVFKRQGVLMFVIQAD